MTIQDAENLEPGDRVFWTDPVDVTCSRFYLIHDIRFTDEITILEADGSVLKCYARELSYMSPELTQFLTLAGCKQLLGSGLPDHWEMPPDFRFYLGYIDPNKVETIEDFWDWLSDKIEVHVEDQLWQQSMGEDL